VDYEFPERKLLLTGMHVPFFPNLLPAHPPPPPHMIHWPYVQPTVYHIHCFTRVCTGLSVTFSATVPTIYYPYCCRNAYRELDVTCCKQRGERSADIARAVQFPGMMIPTIMRGVQETETNAVNLLNHLKVKEVMEVWERRPPPP
jgi:hypothetical protein